jgi:hypothetical protein
MKRMLVALSLLAVLVPPAAMARPHHSLHVYMNRVQPRIDEYVAIAVRLGKLLSARPVTNVDPLVERLYGVANRFEGLEGKWQALPAPKGLRLRHRGMGRVFALYAEAIRIHAAAIFTRHPDEIVAAAPKVEARFRSVAYLQRRWAAALRGALIRADLRVPRWLHRMATIGP